MVSRALRSLPNCLVGVVEEQVAQFPLWPLDVQEVEVEAAGVRNTVRLRQRELLRLLRIGEEDRQPIHQQSARQAVHDRGQHLVEIGFRVQVAAELGQRFPVIVAFAVEKFVQVILYPVFERIEQQRGYCDGGDQSDGPDAGESLMKELRSDAHGRKVGSCNRARGDGVGHAPLKDEVHVHQAVAEDGIAEGERQKDQRQHGDLHPITEWEGFPPGRELHRTK